MCERYDWWGFPKICLVDEDLECLFMVDADFEGVWTNINAYDNWLHFWGLLYSMIRYEILDNSIEVSGKNYERVLFVGNSQGLKWNRLG